MNNKTKYFYSKEGLLICSSREEIDKSYKDKIVRDLDASLGVYFCSSFEYPGRYTRWDIGFTDPPVEIRTFGRRVEISALNKRGQVLVEFIFEFLCKADYFQYLQRQSHKIVGQIEPSQEVLAEEQRSRQKSVFSMVRSMMQAFYSDTDRFLGLYGSFGYDLIFQFESIELKRPRDEKQADMVLFIPDEIFVIDHQKGESFLMCYEFEYNGHSTQNLSRINLNEADYTQSLRHEHRPSYIKGRYADKVKKAKEYFQRGDLFEVVPSHTFYKECQTSPSDIFTHLQKINPSPYGFLINLGNEHLVGASPEMFVRVEGQRIETCPISGTIKRGKNAIEDACRIRDLLNSYKDESELTMCTDVDRNDKSRICIPGSVNVLGRRQIEMYSHLIHTVDHVEGMLSAEYDALDAFMTHMWAVTVTGAPKKAAVQWVEENEDSNRIWYGGAVGILGFDGHINTGLTLRTIRLQDRVAEIRVGATLLYDSIPEEEEEETLVKAAALLKVLGDEPKPETAQSANKYSDKYSEENIPVVNVLFVDHEDSFVHTLAAYFRKAGCRVKTMRHHLAREALQKQSYDLVVLSPGPGRPSDFKIKETIDLCLARKIPIFGVCLGLQGIVEYFDGKLGILDYPMHGKESLVKASPSSVIFKDLESLKVGRYHSLYAEKVPRELEVTAWTEDGIVMAVESLDKTILAVQFHPESIMTMEDNKGFKLITNVLLKIGGVHCA